VRRIVVVRGGALGDLILTLPALAALRRAFPQAHITLIGSAPGRLLTLGRGYADAFWPLDADWLGGLFDPAGRQPPALDPRPDLAIVWLRTPEPAIRYFTALGVEHLLAADPLPPEDSPLHVADHLLATLAPLGLPAVDPVPQIPLTDQERVAATALWRRLGLSPEQTIAVHPGSGSRFKNWPAERFAVLVERLLAAGWNVVLVAGPADTAPLATLQAAGLGVPVLQDQPLLVLGAFLARCRAFIGHDSGVTHLAAAVGAPTLALFGPTAPWRWAPRGLAVRILWRAEPCAPCTPTLRAACPHRRCLTALTVEAVLADLQALLTTTAGPAEPSHQDRGLRRADPTA